MGSSAPPAWLEAIADNSLDATIVLDRQRVIRYANKAAILMADRSGKRDILNTLYDEILGKSTILDEEGKDLPPELFPTQLALQKGITTRGKIFEQNYAGTHFWLSVSCVPLLGAEGKPEYAIVYFKDISALKGHEEKLNFLMRASKVLEVHADPYAHITQTMQLMVPSLADWGTINVATAGGLSRIAIVHRDLAKVPLVERLATLSVDMPSGGIQGVYKSGLEQFIPVVDQETMGTSGTPERVALARELRVCSSMILPIFSQGQVMGILSLAYAESGRHYSEEDLEFMKEFCNHLGSLIDKAYLYNEIHKRDKAKDKFIATLSHELRNPLAPIKSSLELLHLKNTDESLESELGVIEHQFDHLTHLLNDLLDVSRFTLGKIQLDEKEFSLLPLIKTIIQAHQPFIEEKNIALEVRLPQSEVVMWGDETRLEQSLNNLLHNAEKFTPAGGRITVTVEETPYEIQMRVCDTGIGMDETELAGVFELNAQNGEHRAQGGLGIGLLLVRQIMELHGGRVEVKSEGKGKGSEFSLFLPLERTRT